MTHCLILCLILCSTLTRNGKKIDLDELNGKQTEGVNKYQDNRNGLLIHSSL